MKGDTADMNQTNAQTRPSDLLGRIRMADFALVETILYLDAYPDNPQALAFYRNIVSERNRMVEQYEKTVGPLTATGNRSNTSWDWVKAPWPWELAANN